MSSGSLETGSVIDGLYEVVDVIGRGGMGAVFRVHHLEWNLDLAVKMPLPHLMQDKDLWERFIREAETWIDLGVHPNIVQLWYVRVIQGLPLLFLDYAAGGSLKDWQDQGMIQPGDWTTILDLTIQAVDGLAYSHSRGVIHRDVKPANLLVRGADRVCVTDFGIVGNIQTGGTRDQPGTHRSTAGGTAEYAAPEQWEGVVSPSVDIYALGVILFEFSTGQRPFVNDDAHALIEQHLREHVRPPSELRPDIPDSLNQLIVDCLEKDPDRRPHTMEQLRERLVGIYGETVGTNYPRAIPYASEQRADALNNRGVSLWNLDKREQALQAWKEAVQVDAHHTEAAYNRAITQWRLGQISDNDVFERLRLAQAKLYQGYFLLESGRAEQAARMVSKAVKEAQPNEIGLFHRAHGDALMYHNKARLAQQSYALALNSMPNDKATLRRSGLAHQGIRENEDGIYFPTPTAVSTIRHKSAVEELHVDRNTGVILTCGVGWLECWHPAQKALIWAQTLSGCPARLTSDGQRVYALESYPARTWDLATGRLLWEGESGSTLLDVSEELGILVGDQVHLVELSDGTPRHTFGRTQNTKVTCGAFSENGELVALGDEKGLLSAWNSQTGELVSQLPAHDGPISALKLLGENNTALTLASREMLRVWDLPNQRLYSEAPLPLEAQFIEMDASQQWLLAYNEEGDFALQKIGQPVSLQGSGNFCFAEKGLLYERDGQVAFWSFEEKWLARRWAKHKQELTTIATTPDERYLLTGSREGAIQWWHFDEDNRIYEKQLLVTRSSTHAEAESNREAFERSLQQAVGLLESGEFEAAHRSISNARNVKGYALDKRALALKSRLYGRFLRLGLKDLWERRSLQLATPVQDALLLRDRIVTLGIDGLIRFHDAGEWALSVEDASAMEACADGTMLVVATHQGSLSSWNLHGNRLATFQLNSPIQAVRSDPSGRYVVAATEDGQIQVVDLENQTCLVSIPDQEARGRVLSITPDLKFALTGPNHTYWSLLESKKLTKKPIHGLLGASLSQDGKYALVADPQDDVNLVRLAPLEQLRTFRRHDDQVVMLRLWEGLMAAVSLDATGSLAVWDLDQGSTLKLVHSHTDGVVCGWASPDGRFAVTVGVDQQLRVFEMEWELDFSQKASSLQQKFAPSPLGKLGSLFGLR